LYQLPQNPSRLGDLVGLSFRIFRLNWRYLTGKLLTLSLLASIAVSCMQMSIVNWSQNIKNSSPWAITDFVMFAAGFVLILVCQYFLSLRATALYRVVFGLSSDWHDAMQYSTRRKWSVFTVFGMGAATPFLIGTYVILLVFVTALVRMLSSFAGQLIAEILTVFGAFAMTVLLVVGSAVTLLFATLLFAAISSEDKMKFDHVIVRAFKLTWRYPFRGGSYMCLLGLALTFVVLALSIFLWPFEVWEAYQVTQNADMALPFYLRFLEAVSQTINNVVSMGVASIASGLYYRDVQFRSEGADLIERVNKLEYRP
jgi:hypothetical protein